MDANLDQVVLVKDINPGVSNPTYPIDSRSYSGGTSTPISSDPDSLVEFNDQLYFSADDGKHGRELFVSDGTTEGTQLVEDLRPGAGNYGYAYSSAPYGLTKLRDKLYFSASDGKHGGEIFVSDGTAEGTKLLVDLHPGEDNDGNKQSSYARNFVEVNDKLYFSADDGKHDNGIFVSDGTAEGTQLLVDLNTGESKDGIKYGSFASNFVEVNDQLYFTANGKGHGEEPFVSDGTAEGTRLLVDLRPGQDSYGTNSSYASNFVEFNNKLYFTAYDAKHGNELFVSDGTPEGTQLLADIYPGEYNGSNPDNLVEFNNKLYFFADDGKHDRELYGRELFVSDGTAKGTQLLVDLHPGEDDNYGNQKSSYASNLVEFNDQLYFTANDKEYGNELFVSDGTAEGTQLVADINPGEDNYGSPAGSDASDLTVVGDELFFVANNGETGRELFKLTFDDLDESQLIITGTDNPDNLSGADGSEKIQALGGQDTVNGGGGNDTIDGGEGDDNLAGNYSNDSLIGASGNDTIDGGNGNDRLSGGEDNDRLNGGHGADTLSGDNGNDLLRGLDSNDLLTGGNGNDRLNGGFGFDTLEGGAGEDIFVLRSGGGSDTIVGFNLDGDRLGLAGDLQFDDLSFAGNKIMVGEELLVSLEGIDTEQLTSDNFDSI